jgi:hypothetical protein
MQKKLELNLSNLNEIYQQRGWGVRTRAGVARNSGIDSSMRPASTDLGSSLKSTSRPPSVVAFSEFSLPIPGSERNWTTGGERSRMSDRPHTVHANPLPSATTGASVDRLSNPKRVAPRRRAGQLSPLRR